MSEDGGPSENRYQYLGQRMHSPIVGRGNETDWETSSVHRAQLMKLLPRDPEGKRRGTICIFGAGNCRALNLQRLLDRFHEVHLVDLDEARLQAGIDAQPACGNPRLYRWGGVDVCGVDPLLSRYVETRDDKLYDEILQTIQQHKLAKLGKFDCVVSNSLLSALMRRIAITFAADVEKMAELLLKVRICFLDHLFDHTYPGGSTFLLNHFVSSSSLPQLLSMPGDLRAVMLQAIQDNNFFPGCNPQAIDHLLANYEPWQKRIASINVSAPWIHRKREESELCVGFRINLKEEPTE